MRVSILCKFKNSYYENLNNNKKKKFLGNHETPFFKQSTIKQVHYIEWRRKTNNVWVTHFSLKLFQTLALKLMKDISVTLGKISDPTGKPIQKYKNHPNISFIKDGI